MTQFSDSRNRAVSIVVQRSRLAGNHRAYVGFGPTDAGYRDLDSGAVVCADEADVALVAELTAHLVPRALRSAAATSTSAATPTPTPAAAPATPEHTVHPVHAGPVARAITHFSIGADQPLGTDLAKLTELAATLCASPPRHSRECLPPIRAGRLQATG